MDKLIFEAKHEDGSVSTNQSMSWIDIKKPITEVTICGMTLEGADSYFFMFNAVASMQIAPRVTGCNFGSVKDGAVTEFSTEGGGKKRVYSFDFFPYDKSILRSGVAKCQPIKLQEQEMQAQPVM